MYMFVCACWFACVSMLVCTRVSVNVFMFVYLYVHVRAPICMFFLCVRVHV